MSSDRSLIWILLFSAQKDLNSFLWLVQRSPPAYFFGTIHVPYTRVWDYIPLNSKQAFESSRHVYFELDLTNETTIQALLKCQLLPNKGRLKDVLPTRLFDRLKKHLKYIRRMMASWLQDLENDFQFRSGTYASYADNLYQQLTMNWVRKRPIWVMLMVNSLTESDIKSRGIPVLDQYLASQALKDQKETGAVEAVEEQCEPLNALNTTQIFNTQKYVLNKISSLREGNKAAVLEATKSQPQVMFALNQSLSLQERIRYGKAKLTYTTDDLVDLYNCGDLNSVLYQTQTIKVLELRENSTLEERDLKKAQEIQSHLTQELIFKRNERMAKRVKELLHKYQHRSFFFAFGAGHFLGNHSIIEILQKDGYDITHVKPNQRLPKFKSKKTVGGRRECRRHFRRGKPCRRRKRRRKRPTTAPTIDYWNVNLLTSRPKVSGTDTGYRKKSGETTIIKKITKWNSGEALSQGNYWTLLLQLTCLLLFRWLAQGII